MSDNKLTGRELDFAIAEQVFERDRSMARVDPMNRDGEPQYYWGYPLGHDFAPAYSTSIEAAMLVVPVLADKGIFVRIDYGQMWNVSFWDSEGKCLSGDSGDSLAEVVCQCALL